jgi:uncharacterized protein YegJ (DUF2314 family)
MARSRSTGLLRVVAALALGGCGDQGARTPPAEQGRVYDDKTRMLYVPIADTEMSHAIERARATLPEFLPRLQHPPAGQSYVGVKVRLGGDQEGEHIWLYEVRLEDGRIAGRLVDDAEYFPDRKRGEVVRVAPAEISDWMTVEDGRACGGFTSRVVVGQMDSTARAAWLREMEIERLPAGDAVCDEKRAPP